jgi:DNA-binding protein H-NS
MAKKTFIEVQKQIEQLQKEAELLRKQEAHEVLARIKDAITVYGFTATELGFGSGVGKRSVRPIVKLKRGRKSGNKDMATSAAKFRDPNGNVWSGRGPRPAWFKAALEAGKAPEDLLAK